MVYFTFCTSQLHNLVKKFLHKKSPPHSAHLHSVHIFLHSVIVTIDTPSSDQHPSASIGPPSASPHTPSLVGKHCSHDQRLSHKQNHHTRPPLQFFICNESTMSNIPQISSPGSATYDSNTLHVGDGTWRSDRDDFLLPNLMGINFATMRYNGEYFYPSSYPASTSDRISNPE
jgi:hypothetical protein